MKYISGNVSVLNLNNLHFKFTQRINLINADNAKGKTTFLKCLCNLIKFNGEILDDKDHRIATDNISFFFSGDEFLESDMTVIQNWEYMLGGQIKDNVLFTGFGLNTQSDVLVKELSEGNKQKLRLAITLNRKKNIMYLMSLLLILMKNLLSVWQITLKTMMIHVYI